MFQLNSLYLSSLSNLNHKLVEVHFRSRYPFLSYCTDYRSLLELCHFPPTRRFNPPLPQDQLLSFYISSCRLVSRVLAQLASLRISAFLNPENPPGLRFLPYGAQAECSTRALHHNGRVSATIFRRSATTIESSSHTH
ncbi:hypothetical protein Y032_0191g1323 [Ancylostoma ceylanicum]|uniref:Uncharacterized protein n=1 Tax=Ancylostoma ceylanicum TaxID=53326 RepID=A0A016SPT4_9BILA|nr:hypothetical protein Y032_0191g1323 [Ancylostoma ceylanicum]